MKADRLIVRQVQKMKAFDLNPLTRIKISYSS